MKGNAALKLTTALYYTPSGRSIQAKGIVPDIEVANIKPLETTEKRMELKEKDLEKSLASDNKQDAAKPVTKEAPHGGTNKNSTDLSNDYQLRRALELLQSINMLKEKQF